MGSRAMWITRFMRSFTCRKSSIRIDLPQRGTKRRKSFESIGLKPFFICRSASSLLDFSAFSRLFVATCKDVTPAKVRLFTVGAVICLVGAIAWWFFANRTSPPPIAVSPTVEASPKPASSRIAQPAHVPDEPLPAEGIHFSADSSDEELLQLARTVILRSPQQALSWAQSLNDPELRERLLFAVLRAWGEQDPRAALTWALQQDESQRSINVEAALAGAATQPDLALELGRELLAQDAASDTAYSSILVGALSAAGKFQAALRFASQGPADSRADWLANIFHRWGESLPDEAVKALNTLDQKESHDAAFQALVAGWAAGNPSGLAAYAVKLPPGEDRTRALGAALDNWSMQDPASAGEWLNDLPASPELDQAIAGLITRTDRVNRSPEVAISWVESISDLKLRRDTLIQVMQEWAQTEPAAAWKYFKEVSWLDETERIETQKTIQKKIEAANSIQDSEE
jgi:hypothetical protein